MSAEKIPDGPQVTKQGVLNMQVCVPESWTDDQILSFAEREFPCGTSAGWSIRREGSEYLGGCHERVPCEGRTGYVHIMLDA